MVETRKARRERIAAEVTSGDTGETQINNPVIQHCFNKCDKCHKKLIAHSKITCTICGYDYHKKCFSVIPRSKNYNYIDICEDCTINIFPFSTLHGNKYHEALLEFQYQVTDIRELVSLSENFREIIYDYSCRESSDILKNIDPDTNNINVTNNDSCKYFFPSQFPKSQSSQFSFFHLNIRSIRNNFDKLKLLLATTKHLFDIIVLSETWLDDGDNTDVYDIDGYSTIFQNRPDRERGGVCIYVNNFCYDFQLLPSLSFRDTYNNILSIKLFPKYQHDMKKRKQKGRQKIFTACYRSPDANNKSFITNLTTILNNIFKTKKASYITGDMNYNIINVNHHHPTQEYHTLLTSHMYHQVISKPTRITDNTATLIDHIWHNDTSTGCTTLNNTPGIIYSDISDHLPIFLNISSNTTRNVKIKISYRQFNTENFNTYRQKLREIKTDDYFKPNDIDVTHLNFCDRIVGIINHSFPLKEKIIRQKTLNNKWLSSSLLKDLKLKNRLFAKKLKYPTKKNIDLYHAQLKKVERDKKSDKRKYFRDELEKYNNNIKKKWDVLREIILNKRKVDEINSITHEDSMITDKTKMSKIFVDYFKNIGSSLASKFQDISNRTFKRWLYRSPRPPEAYKIPEIYPCDVENVIEHIDTSKGAGVDEISPKLLKEGKNELMFHLTNLFNISISAGQFPHCHKLARCVPIFKRNGESTLVSNYRPISIITSIGKLLEKLIAGSFTEYLERNKIICEQQHGFRKHRNVQTALLDFTTSISDTLDKNNKAIGIFLDLSKAFDTVSHDILLQKLSYYGCTGTELQWFTSYLTDRSIQVNLDKNNTNYDNLKQVLNCGVPQGSILGPILFLIYINDIIYTSDKVKITLYADDTNILISKDNATITDLINDLNVILLEFNEYFKSNRLTVNIDKTKYMIFNTPHNRRKEHDNFINNGINITKKKKKIRKTKYPCGQCHKGVRVDAILCSICNKWYHRNCLQAMKKEDLLFWGKHYPDSWICHSCIEDILPINLVNAENILDTDNDIQDRTTNNAKTILPQKNKYPKVLFGDLEVERVTNIKFLGVILSESLNWTDHMNYILSKVNKNIGYFYRARRILDEKELINLFRSFVEPYVTYCLPVWGGYINMDSNNNPLNKVINRLKRIMTFSKRTHIADNKINLYTLKQYYILGIAKTIYNHNDHPENSPLIYHTTIQQIQDTHNHNTRSSARLNLTLPKFNGNYKKNSFGYQSAKTWNSLPYPIKLKKSKSNFLDALNRYMSELNPNNGNANNGR